MTTVGIRLVVLLVLQTLWLDASHSQGPASPKVIEEISKQEGIYRSQGEKVPAGYTIDRSLEDYVDTLPPGFDRALANLGPNDRWLDIGAGKGHAILDYYSLDFDLKYPEGREKRGTKAQAVAISVEDRRTPIWQQSAARLGTNQIQYFFNKYMRDYSLEELGQFQIITDLLGGFSYTNNLSLFMEKVLGFLALNGRFYTLLQDVHAEEGTNKPYYAGAPFLTEITRADGSEVKVCSWLKSITCVEVACELKISWRPPIETYRIHKICNDVTVPALLLKHYEAGTPPERRLQLGN